MPAGLLQNALVGLLVTICSISYTLNFKYEGKVVAECVCGCYDSFDFMELVLAFFHSSVENHAIINRRFVVVHDKRIAMMRLWQKADTSRMYCEFYVSR